MSKYSPLGDFLRAQDRETVPLSFADIAKIVGHSLPASSRYPAWWSNNETNNVMTSIWLDAGFRTEQVDIPGKKLVFRRHKPGLAEAGREFAPRSPGARNPIIGALKGTIRVMVDLTLPADPDWGAA